MECGKAGDRKGRPYGWGTRGKNYGNTPGEWGRGWGWFRFSDYSRG